MAGENATMTTTGTGGCVCGAVRFTTYGPLRDVIACHCEQCRRQSGHFLAATACADTDLEVTGTAGITWYEASDNARRGFCRRCGSGLFWKANGTDRTSILAGAFDQPSGLKLTSHIYCREKGDYYEVTDGLPQFVTRE